MSDAHDWFGLLNGELHRFPVDFKLDPTAPAMVLGPSTCGWKPEPGQVLFIGDEDLPQDRVCQRCVELLAGGPEVMNDVTKQMAREMELLKLRGPNAISINPLDAFTLVAALQLAYRHPHLSPAQKEIIRSFGNELTKLFEDCLQVMEVIRWGWDPSRDG